MNSKGIGLVCSVVLVAAFSQGVEGQTAPAISQTQRGAVVQTDRYRAEIRSGVLVSFLNRLTGEEYLDGNASLGNIVPHLPSGLGTQNGEDAIKAARKLYSWPWWEYPADSVWLCQHYPADDATFEFAANAPGGCVLTYKGLTDGKSKFSDEVYSLQIEVEAGTGDLLVTPSAKSPREGVYAANLTVLALTPAVTIEAPIFDGVRLDRHMKSELWVNAWGGFWDYPFLALNGYRRGCVGVWMQDADLKHYKTVFYLVNQEALSFSLSAMNIPPFEKLTESRVLPWRFQAFEKGWPQAAARFRDWRLKDVKIAPRPDWATKVSFVNLSVSANKMWLDILKGYLEGQDLDRTMTFLPAVRQAQFDTKHWDNAPYAAFKDDLKAWKASGARVLAYLQPMIVWSTPTKEEEETARPIVNLHRDADTHSAFLADPNTVGPHDHHHLGHQEWQKWFLAWVKSYIQDYGADAVHHDSTFGCPTDRRGLDPKLGGMTSSQGMADYFYKAQAQNPGSIHGTEHMTEVNNVGASLGAASGIGWGTPPMLAQKLHHASPISAALHYPNGVLFPYPHASELCARGDPTLFHWGHNLMERRAEIAGTFLQYHFYTGQVVPFAEWHNELWLDRLRVLLFVRHNLRPVFPEDWDRNVLSYFKGASGEDFRYEKMPWGTALIQVEADRRTVHYGRIHGVTEANVAGGVAGWVCYNAGGPAGLNPDRYYCLDPALRPPEVCFSTDNMFASGLLESYVEDGAVAEKFTFVRIRAIPSTGNVHPNDSLVLHSPVEPKAIFVAGRPVDVAKTRRKSPDGNALNEWKIGFTTPSDIVAFLDEIPRGFGALKEAAVLRVVPRLGTSDVFSPAWLNAKLIAGKDKQGRATLGFDALQVPGTMVYQLSVAVKPPDGAQKGTLRITVASPGTSGLLGFAVNGKDAPFVAAVEGNKTTPPVGIDLKADEPALLTFMVERGCTCAFEWQEAATAPAK